MDVSDEVRAAAKRIVWWDAGIPPSRIYATTDLIEAANNDAWDLARAHIARLAADDAEQAERAKPIDKDWCLGLPGAEKHSRGMRFALPPHGGYPTAIVWNDGWCFICQANDIADFDDESCVQVPCATRGQLLDLLAALKGGDA